MLFSIMWGHIQDQTTNFEHLVHETWPRTCGRVVFKFYKKQTKSENHETCQDVMISYVEAVIKIWGGFAQVVTYDACKPKNPWRSFMISWRGRPGGKHRMWQLAQNLLKFLSQPPHMISWHLDKFHDFQLRLLFIEFKNNSTASSWSCFMNKISKFRVCS